MTGIPPDCLIEINHERCFRFGQGIARIGVGPVVVLHFSLIGDEPVGQKRDVLAGIESFPCAKQKRLRVRDGGRIVERIGRVRIKFTKLPEKGVLVVSLRHGGDRMHFLRGILDLAVGRVDAQNTRAHPLLRVADDDGRLGGSAVGKGDGVGLHNGEAFHLRHRHVQVDDDLPAAGVQGFAPAVRAGFPQLRDGLEIRTFRPRGGQAAYGQRKTGTHAKHTAFHTFPSRLSVPSGLRRRSQGAPGARFGCCLFRLRSGRFGS